MDISQMIIISSSVQTNLRTSLTEQCVRCAGIVCSLDISYSELGTFSFFSGLT